jgi:hypothetical protein
VATQEEKADWRFAGGVDEHGQSPLLLGGKNSPFL